jgi:hypothetical protein
MNVNEVAVFTVQLVNEIFVLPSGARTIDLNNIGGGTATYIGNTNKGGKTVSPVSIASSVAYSFGDLGKSYPEITIDATGTTVDLTANY